MNARRMNTLQVLATGLVLPLLLAGCPSESTSQGEPAPVGGGPNGSNEAPTITGTPPGVVEIGVNYSFTPEASDPDNDPLTFSIQNAPVWAQFDSSTGALAGIPQAGDEDTYSSIAITVSDGVLTASLASFSVTVNADGGAPTAPLTSIPDVPFDYAKAPGPVTRSGTLPGSLVAGEVLALGNQSFGGDGSLSCNGTEANPAFVLGGTIQGSNNVFNVSGAWCIFVDTVFDNMQLRTSGNHLVFRNVEITNVSGKNGTSFGGSHVVLADSEVHHNQGDDRHGVHVSSGADSIWILRNHVHHNGGDGFQACHGCSSNPPR
ncbi:MAG: putative Ig domain-containing protein, partial [Woeseiaceae bacterium]